MTGARSGCAVPLSHHTTDMNLACLLRSSSSNGLPNTACGLRLSPPPRAATLAFNSTAKLGDRAVPASAAALAVASAPCIPSLTTSLAVAASDASYHASARRSSVAHLLWRGRQRHAHVQPPKEGDIHNLNALSLAASAGRRQLVGMPQAQPRVLAVVVRVGDAHR